ncbi:MAG: hypothetical protein MZV63_19475 [Marinilabiliales bacterium]|nr:hypothetical protein [Marinilabiliales bacterium]
MFWELTLIPLFFLIDLWGGEKAARGQPQLRAVHDGRFDLHADRPDRGLSAHAGTSRCSLRQPSPGRSAMLPRQEQVWLLLAFLVGFGVKIPIFPAARLAAAGPCGGAEPGQHSALRRAAQDGRLRPAAGGRDAAGGRRGAATAAGRNRAGQHSLRRLAGLAADRSEGDDRLFLGQPHGRGGARYFGLERDWACWARACKWRRTA